MNKRSRNITYLPKYRVKLVREKRVAYDVTVGCFEAASKLIHNLTKDLDREAIYVVYLNRRNELIGTEQVALGGAGQCSVCPSDILRGVLLSTASAFIIGHNHPSGDPSPSSHDIHMTKELVKAAKIIGLELLDHVIVTSNGSCRSLRDEGAFND